MCKLNVWSGVEINTLKWFCYFEKMRSEWFVNVYESESQDLNTRGKPLGRWKDRVKKFLGKKDINGRGLPEQSSRVL